MAFQARILNFAIYQRKGAPFLTIKSWPQHHNTFPIQITLVKSHLSTSPSQQKLFCVVSTQLLSDSSIKMFVLYNWHLSAWKAKNHRKHKKSKKKINNNKKRRKYMCDVWENSLNFFAVASIVSINFLLLF